MSKPKVGFYWCASCGGCEEAIIDLAEDILPVVEAVDIAFWPVALDFKRTDVEALSDRELAATFINGSVRSSEQYEMVELLRKKSQLIVAFGSCAHLGGIPGLANMFDRKEMFEEI
jgi:F420-non-reducing hydrogenase small subunit